MGIVIRQSLKGTLITYLGVGVGFINTLWLYPKILTPDEIGLFRTLIDATYIFAIFAQLGSSNICIKYFPFFRNRDDQHGGFLFYLLSIVLIGFILVLLALLIFQENILSLFLERSPLLFHYKLFILPLVLVVLYQSLFDAYSQSLLRIVYPKFLKEVLLRVLFSVAVVFVYFQVFDIYGFIMASVVAYAIILFLQIVYVGHLGHLFLKPNFKIFQSNLSKDMATFGFFMLMGSGTGMIVNKIDTIMISSLVGLESTGIYSIAFFIGVFIELPRRSLTSITSPLIAQAWKNNDLPEIQRIYTKSSENLLLIGLYLFIGVWLNIDSLFSLIPNSEIYSQGKYVVLFIGLAKVMTLALGNNGEIIINSKYYKWNMFLVPGLAVLTVGTNLWLIPQYGINGAAFATLLSYFIYGILRFLIAWWKLGIQPFTLNTLKTLAIFGIVLLGGSYIPGSGMAIVDILITSVVVTLGFGTLVLILKPSPDVDLLVRSLISKILGR